MMHDHDFSWPIPIPIFFEQTGPIPIPIPIFFPLSNQQEIMKDSNTNKVII